MNEWWTGGRIDRWADVQREDGDVSRSLQGTDDAFLGQHPRGKEALPAAARAMAPGLFDTHLEVNPLENKYFRHLDTGPPSGNLRGLDSLPHPQMQAHQSLTATSMGDADLSQESVRAAGHLPGPPLLGPCPSSLAAPPTDRTFLKAATACLGFGARKAREGPRSSPS